MNNVIGYYKVAHHAHKEVRKQEVYFFFTSAEHSRSDACQLALELCDSNNKTRRPSDDRRWVVSVCAPDDHRDIRTVRN